MSIYVPKAEKTNGIYSETQDYNPVMYQVLI